MQRNEANLKEALFKFKDLMEDCGIEFALAYGTLLGACRNGCLLPWDVDIDVVIISNDYEECANKDIFGMLREASRRGFIGPRWAHEFIIDTGYFKYPEIALLPEKEQWKEFLKIDPNWKIERFGMSWKCQDSSVVGIDGWVSVKGIHKDLDTYDGKIVLYGEEFNVPPNRLEYLSNYYGKNWKDVFCSYELWLKYCEELRIGNIPQEVEEFMSKWKPLLEEGKEIETKIETKKVV